MVETGTATNYTDLLAKLRTFLTATLSAPERWTELRYVTSGPHELILQGPGSGTDEIIVGIKTIEDGVGDYQNWKLGGFTGYLGGAPFEAQPGYSGEAPGPVHFTLWNSSIPYWFIADGRRVIVVAKISTSYMWCHLGFLNTYASPGQYPYPLLIGGNLAWGNTAPPAVTSADWRWSYAGVEHANPPQNFFNGFSDPSGGYTGRSQLRLRLASGTWRDLWSGWQSTYDPNLITAIGDRHYNSGGSIPTWRQLPEASAGLSGVWPCCTNLDAMEAQIDGGYATLPLIVMAGARSGDAADLLGEIAGVFQVTGGPSAEDLLDIGGDDYLVVPNVHRQNRADYVAIKLV